ncbi:MAG: hypothetical protein ABI862_14475 [Ilumatobacteraceae bacterium]
MNPRDPFEIFKLCDPFADTELTDGDELNLRRIISTDVASGRRAHGGRKVVAVAVAGVGLLATAAFTILKPEKSSNPVVIVCYREANLNADRSVLPASTDPIGDCSKPWRDGTFADGAVPDLTECINADGTTVVFPGRAGVCSVLGLPDQSPGRTGEQQSIVDLQDQLSAAFTSTCFHQDQSISEAQRLLDESGLDGWKVQLAEPFPPGSECGAIGILADSKTVLVLGGRPESP